MLLQRKLTSLLTCQCIDDERKLRAFDILKEERRSLFFNGPCCDLGDFKVGVDFVLDAMEFTDGFKIAGKVAKSGKMHNWKRIEL